MYLRGEKEKKLRLPSSRADPSKKKKKDRQNKITVKWAFKNYVDKNLALF